MTQLRTYCTLLILVLSIILLGCSEQEFRSKYEGEIKQEIKDIVKDSVREVLLTEDLIEINKPVDFEGLCTLTNLKCMDFVVNQDSITLQLGSNQEFDLIVKDFLVSDCTKATSNPKRGNSQMFQFADCNNGAPGSTFDQDITLIIDDKRETGHIRSSVFE